MTTDAAFEDDLHRLEQIVDDLERGEPGLSESLAKYEQGVRLLARCHGLLDRAEQSVALLAGVDADGNPVTAPFDDSAPPSEIAPAAPAPVKPAPKPRKRPPAPPADDGNESFIPF